MDEIDLRLLGVLFGLVIVLVGSLFAMFRMFIKETRTVVQETKIMHSEALGKLDSLIACNHKIKIELAKQGQAIEYNRERIELAHDRITDRSDPPRMRNG